MLEKIVETVPLQGWKVFDGEKMSETIDDVLKRQQMAPSAWAGLDFDILAKSSKSSAMMFSENGTLIDPADIDFSDGSINPWQTGKVVEVLLPDDILRMSNVYYFYGRSLCGTVRSRSNRRFAQNSLSMAWMEDGNWREGRWQSSVRLAIYL